MGDGTTRRRTVFVGIDRARAAHPTTTEVNVTADGRIPGRANSRAKLLTLKQVADQLSVNERHVRRLVAERRIPYVKWGHLLRFDPDELAEWLDGSRRRTA